MDTQELWRDVPLTPAAPRALLVGAGAVLEQHTFEDAARVIFDSAKEAIGAAAERRGPGAAEAHPASGLAVCAGRPGQPDRRPDRIAGQVPLGEPQPGASHISERHGCLAGRDHISEI